MAHYAKVGKWDEIPVLGKKVFAVHAALGTHTVSAMGINQPVPRHLTQPEMERHGGILEVIGKPAVSIDENFLHDIAGIDSSTNALIETHCDHTSQRIAMTVQQLAGGRGITLARSGQQGLRFRGVRPDAALCGDVRV